MTVFILRDHSACSVFGRQDGGWINKVWSFGWRCVCGFFFGFFFGGERRRGRWDGEGWWAPATAAAPSLSTERVHVPSPGWPVLIPARVPSRYNHSWGKTQTTLLREDNLTAAVGFSRSVCHIWCFASTCFNARFQFALKITSDWKRCKFRSTLNLMFPLGWGG